MFKLAGGGNMRHTKKTLFIAGTFLAIAFSCTPSPIRVGVERSISTSGSDRGTAYLMANKVTTWNNKIVFTWLDSTFSVQIMNYDLSTGNFSSPVQVGKTLDNHGSPAIAVDQQGIFHLVFGGHSIGFSHWYTATPGGINNWLQGPDFNIGSSDETTYPSLVIDRAGNLHLTYRAGVGGRADRRVLNYRRLNKNARQWGAPVALADAGNFQYRQYGNPLAIDSNGTLHLAFHLYGGTNRAGSSYAIGYLRSTDGGTTWTTVDGQTPNLPVTQGSPALIPISSTPNDARVGTIAIDPQGRPWLTVIENNKNSTGSNNLPRGAFLWFHNHNKWVQVRLLPTLNNLRPGKVFAWGEPGSITFDHNNWLYYAGSYQDASLTQSFYGHRSTEPIILCSRDEGLNFDEVPLLTSSDPMTPGWLVNMERPTGPQLLSQKPSFIYTRGNDPNGTVIFFGLLE